MLFKYLPIFYLRKYLGLLLSFRAPNILPHLAHTLNYQGRLTPHMLRAPINLLFHPGGSHPEDLPCSTMDNVGFR